MGYVNGFLLVKIDWSIQTMRTNDFEHWLVKFVLLSVDDHGSIAMVSGPVWSTGPVQCQVPVNPRRHMILQVLNNISRIVFALVPGEKVGRLSLPAVRTRFRCDQFLFGILFAQVGNDRNGNEPIPIPMDSNTVGVVTDKFVDENGVHPLRQKDSIIVENDELCSEICHRKRWNQIRLRRDAKYSRKENVLPNSLFEILPKKLLLSEP